MKNDVLAPPAGPHHLVVAADLGLGGNVGQPLRLPLHLDLHLVPQVAEHRLEVGVVGVLAPEVLGQLSCLALRRGPSCWHREGGRVAHAVAARSKSRWRSMSSSNRP